MPEPVFEISFVDTTDAQASILAGQLEDTLRRVGPDVSLRRERKRSDSMDFGGTLILVLGTTSVTTIAAGLGAFLHRNSGARISIRKDGEVVAENLNSSDVPAIAKAFSPR